MLRIFLFSFFAISFLSGCLDRERINDEVAAREAFYSSIDSDYYDPKEQYEAATGKPLMQGQMPDEIVELALGFSKSTSIRQIRTIAESIGYTCAEDGEYVAWSLDRYFEAQNNPLWCWRNLPALDLYTGGFSNVGNTRLWWRRSAAADYIALVNYGSNGADTIEFSCLALNNCLGREINSDRVRSHFELGNSVSAWNVQMKRCGSFEGRSEYCFEKYSFSVRDRVHVPESYARPAPQISVATSASDNVTNLLSATEQRTLNFSGSCAGHAEIGNEILRRRGSSSNFNQLISAARQSVASILQKDSGGNLLREFNRWPNTIRQSLGGLPDDMKINFITPLLIACGERYGL
jgi:hypothetical protein